MQTRTEEDVLSEWLLHREGLVVWALCLKEAIQSIAICSPVGVSRIRAGVGSCFSADLHGGPPDTS
jgi:hypothetical protein